MTEDKKIAYLILAHHQPELLNGLVSRLKIENAHFFVHIDKKSDIAPFKKINYNANITFIRNRVNVRWGGFSQIQAILKLLNNASKDDNKFSRYTLLSGCDAPVYSAIDTYKVLSSTESDFLHIDEIIDEHSHHLSRIKKYHYFDFPLRHSKIRLIKSIAKKIIKTKQWYNGERAFYKNLTAYHGSQWWSLSRKTVEYILDYIKENQEIIDFYQHVGIPDENFFQTMVMNSPFRGNLISSINPHNKYTKAIHYIDWYSKGVRLPKVLEKNDLLKIKDSGALFIRKTDIKTSKTLLECLPLPLLDSNISLSKNQ